MAQPAEKSPATLYTKTHDVFRGTYFQAVLLGLISFTQPGIWTAMNSLGAGGQAEPYAVNAANVITFVFMFVLSPLGGILGNLIGMHWVVAMGCIGYVPYSAALYCNSVFGTQWFLIFGAATCGISATFLWSGEAALAVGYPEANRRGLCISIWTSIGKLGTIIAGAIQLALNKDKNQTGSIAPRTYLVLTAIQCLGLPLSLLISPPHKLVRVDGTKPTFTSTTRTFRSQIKAYLSQFKRKEVVLLIPAFIAGQWGATYQSNYLAAYFTVRARTLASFLQAIVGIIVNLLMGWWFDTKYVRRSWQARGLWYLVLPLFTLVWIYFLVLQSRWDKSPPGEIDWSSGHFHEGVAVYILYRIAYEIVGMWLYWIMGTFDSDVDTLNLSICILRGGEALGSALSYAVGSARSASLMTNLIVSVVVFYVAAPFTTWGSHLVTDLKFAQDSGSDSDAGNQGVQTLEDEHLRVGGVHIINEPKS